MMYEMGKLLLNDPLQQKFDVEGGEFYSFY